MASPTQHSDSIEFLRSSCGPISRVESEDGVRSGKRRNADSIAFPDIHVHHRRSKSASDRNVDAPKGKASDPRKDRNEILVSPPPRWACGVQSPLRDPFCRINNYASSNNRASLEKDIEQLQSHLQQEKSMRLMLEKAMGRASSTLSPGHRHVASQTKELISEIELLEEEVANREQHVLSLYRNIFEQCVSQSSSQQSSTKASPAHSKSLPRKHPSIISSAFCSSKKFPLRPFKALIGSVESGKRTPKKDYALPFAEKTEVHFERPYPNSTKVQATERTSTLRTLKDHLHRCPSKLSQEMVRCMAAVYCWLRSTSSTNPSKSCSPLLSRSSTNVVLPQRGVKDDLLCSSKSVVEISWISTDKKQFSRASYAINNYRMLVEQLERVDFSQMNDNARTAFWVNVYNSLVMHAYLAYGIPQSSLRRLALFHKAAYNIGGYIISANAIEQSIFCFQTPRVGWWLETIVSAALRKRSGQERHRINTKFGLPTPQPLICFALCTGAASDPLLKVYTGLNLEEELEAARRVFLQTHVVMKKSKLFLPKLVERFAKEASICTEDILAWVINNLDRKHHELLQSTNRKRNGKKVSQIIEWRPYCSRFQYTFSKDLTEKPWWA